jgi:hypothetical protein
MIGESQANKIENIYAKHFRHSIKVQIHIIGYALKELGIKAFNQSFSPLSLSTKKMLGRSSRGSIHHRRLLRLPLLLLLHRHGCGWFGL